MNVYYKLCESTVKYENRIDLNKKNRLTFDVDRLLIHNICSSKTYIRVYCAYITLKFLWKKKKRKVHRFAPHIFFFLSDNRICKCFFWIMHRALISHLMILKSDNVVRAFLFLLFHLLPEPSDFPVHCSPVYTEKREDLDSGIGAKKPPPRSVCTVKTKLNKRRMKNRL